MPKPRPKDEEHEVGFDPAVDFPVVNATLCCLMALLLPWVFLSVMTTWEARLLLVQCILGVAVFIFSIERAGERLGVWLSTGALAVAPFNNPLNVTADSRSSKSMAKFKAQLWQLIVHIAFTLLELKTLAELTRNGEDDWWERAVYMFYSQAENGFLLELLYSLQLAVWFVTGFFQVFVFERVKDHLVMLAHHVATIILLGLSYQHGYMRLGLMVLYIHDATDIVIDTLKLTNGLQLEGPRGGFLVEISFVSTLASWFYYRLYLLPKCVIYQAAYHGAICAMVFSQSGGMPADVNRVCSVCWDRSPEAIEAAGQVVAAAVARGDEPPFEKIWVVAVVATALLSVLFVMHIYWYLLFVRIAVKLLTGEKPHDVGEVEYEGSDGLASRSSPSRKRD